jgi:hypothetical protein
MKGEIGIRIPYLELMRMSYFGIVSSNEKQGKVLQILSFGRRKCEDNAYFLIVKKLTPERNTYSNYTYFLP